jgi:hypothetical protein
MNIRASMLPSYPDCPRRAVAKQYRRTFERQGYKFRELPPSVGAAAGTAVHTGAEMLLRAKHAGRTITLDQALEPAMAGFSEETGKGAIWDDTTPNANVATEQIKRMVACYSHGPLATEMPLTVNEQPAVELELEANAGDGWKLTGHIDLVTEAGWVRDTKTGALSRPYHAQLGAYSLLVRSNSILPVVKGAAIDFIKRVGKTKPQPPCETQEYQVAACERNAMALINRLKDDMAQFNATGDVNCFMANQMSMMCSDKYCPAWGTKFCELSGEK